jgi:hypothetical protein
LRDTTSRDEQGSALVIALVMLTVVGLLVGAALTYAGTSLRTTKTAYRPNRAALYDADSAIQTAMQYVKARQAAGDSIGQDLGLPCPTSTLDYPGTTGTVHVDICPQADSFISEGEFRAVLLALGNDPSEGIILNHNGDVNVGGHIFSNSLLALGNSTNLKVRAGKVWAWGDCIRPGNITITNPASTTVCNASSVFGGVKPKIALDPGDPALGHPGDWRAAQSAPLSLTQPAIPACVNNTAALLPGVYFDPNALTALTTTCTTVTLQAGGVYWLDFPSASTPWQISKTVVGPAPSTCDGTNGVQLVFANQSKLTLAAQHQNDPTEPALLSIPCALSSTPDGPRIAIYGLNPAGTTVFRPTAAADTNGGFFTATANALPASTPGYPQDATQATATIPRRSTAELTLNSFAADPATPMPAGATIDSVVVSVAHNEASGITLTPTITWGSCSVALSPVENTNPTVWTSANLRSSFASCLASQVSTMSLKWQARTPNNGATRVAQVDGAQVAMNWTTAGVPALNGCIVDVGGCSLIDPGSNSGEIAIADVVYIPRAKLAGQFNLNGSSKISTALIARDIDLNINPNICGTCASFGDPVDRPLLGRVLFKARIDSTAWIDAYATFDRTTFDPTVEAWVVKR